MTEAFSTSWRWALFGLLGAIVAFVGAIPIQILIQPLLPELLVQSCWEEAARAALMALAWRTISFSTSSTAPFLAFGCGFASLEATWNLMAYARPPDFHPVFWMLEPIAPALGHVVDSIILGIFLQSGGVWTGFLICVLIHSGYNLYVALVTSRLTSLDALYTDILTRNAVLGVALMLVMHVGRRRARAR